MVTVNVVEAALVTTRFLALIVLAGTAGVCLQVGLRKMELGGNQTWRLHLAPVLSGMVCIGVAAYHLYSYEPNMGTLMQGTTALVAVAAFAVGWKDSSWRRFEAERRRIRGY